MSPFVIPIIGTLAEKVLDRLIASPATTVTAAEAPAVKREVEKAIAPVIEHLTNTEPAVKSRVTQGAVGAIIVAAGSMLVMYSQDTLTSEAVLSQGSIIVGGCWTLYGRWKAAKPFGS